MEQAIAWGGRILLGDEMGLGTPHVPITYMADYIVCVGARCAFCVVTMHCILLGDEVGLGAPHTYSNFYMTHAESGSNK